MVIPWTNYQRNLTEQYSCIKSQTQALKSQLNWKQQQYKSLLMKGPKAKEKIRETRRQIEQLLQLVRNLIFQSYLIILSVVISTKSSSNINKYEFISTKWNQFHSNGKKLSINSSKYLDR
jgi:hypothetical protein